MDLFPAPRDSGMKVNLAPGEHPGILGVEIQLDGLSFSGFPEVQGCEIFVDQGLFLSLNCDEALAGSGGLGRIVVVLRHKRFQLRLNFPNPRQCEVIAGCFCRTLTVMNP